MTKEELLKRLESIVKEDNDHHLNIEVFFDRCLLSIKNSGVDFTSQVYKVPRTLLHDMLKWQEGMS